MSAFKDLPTSPVLRQVARLNKIAGTPATAFRFDPLKVREIEVFLTQKNAHPPSKGLRKFWKENMPTLRFHNDDVGFAMTRIAVNKDEDLAKMKAKIVVHTTNDGSQSINCANKDQSVILDELVKLTEAKPVPEAEIPVISNPH